MFEYIWKKKNIPSKKYPREKFLGKKKKTIDGTEN